MSFFTLAARGAAAALIVPAAVLSSAPAQAADLNVVCVGAPVGVTCDSTAATINAATVGLKLNGLDDLIAVGPGTYDAGPIVLEAGAHALALQGSGDQTVITLPSSVSVQTYVQSIGADVRDLKLVMTGGAESSSDWGLNLFGGSVQDVTIEGEGLVNVTGVASEDAPIDDTTVSLGGTGRGAILIGDAQVSDTTITAQTGINAGTNSTGNQRVTRTRITAANAGVILSAGEVAVDNTLIRLVGASGGAGIWAGGTNPGPQSSLVTADHLTIVGGNSNSRGVYALANTQLGRHSATILLSNSVISGPDYPIMALASNDGNQGGASEAYVGVDHTDYDDEEALQEIGANGTGGIDEGVGNIDADPQFLSVVNGNYMPGPGSPLIDAGDPAAGTSTTDILGHQRVADGNNDVTAIRDMGAYELPDSFGAQTSSLGGPSGTFRDRTPTFTFSSEPGATFTCRIDAKPAVGCTSPFTSPSLADGSHKLTVTAKDATGNADATPSTRTFTVDNVAPNTRFVSKPALTIRTATARFRFAAPGAVRFQCKLDARPWRACTSPKVFSVAKGRHVVRVRGIDRAGNVDATPALYRFKRV